MNYKFSILFIILFSICVYYLYRINECSSRFRNLKKSFSSNINDNISLLLKNYNSTNFFEVKMNENLLFQKFNIQEKILSHAIDYVNK